MGVSGEFRYFGPALSSLERVRPVKAMTLPPSLLIGNMTRLRNFAYTAETAASDFRLSASATGLWASGFRLADDSLSLSFRAEPGICCSLPGTLLPSGSRAPEAES